MSQVGISAAAAWTRGPVPGCLWLWARLYQAGITSECSHGLYSGWLATVCGLVTVVAVPVTVRREPAWPGQPGTGRGIPSNTQQHYSTHAAYNLILQQNFAKCSQYCIGHIRYFTARH